jgi:hypothetical protein
MQSGGQLDAQPLPGTGLALAAFTLASTRDGSKPKRQHALLSPSMSAPFVAHMLGGRLARFEWLSATAAMDLLHRAFEKRARKAIEAADAHRAATGVESAALEADARLYRAALDGTRDWRDVAREVLGWPMGSGTPVTGLMAA